MATETITINTLAELVAFVENSKGECYVRWSKYPEKDIARGYSVNWSNGDSEQGLSFLTLEKKAENDTWAEQFAYIAWTSDIYQYKGLRCWIGSGKKSAQGSDGEPLLYDVCIKAHISTKCINEMQKFNRAQGRYRLWPATPAELKWAEKYKNEIIGALGE